MNINTDQEKLVQTVSISGGRTSHYMIQVLIEKYGKDGVKFIYCDTGAEHPETYTFVKDTAKYFDIEITCLKLFMPKEKGVGAQYRVVPLESIKQDFEAFRSLMEKYGRPFMPGGKFCTDQMKTQIYKKYCNDTFGKDNYTTWIGYRNEPRDASRVWGHTLSGTLSKWFDIPKAEQGEFYVDCRNALLKSKEALYNLVEDYVAYPNDVENDKRVNKIAERVIERYETGFRFLFEISDYDKSDISYWWKTQEFDLNIPPQCGNCVFCIEKSENQLAYLVKSQPEQADLWQIELDNPAIPYKESRKKGQDVIYRGGKTFQDIRDLADTMSLEEWEDRVNRETKLRPCASGECSVFGDED